MQNPPAEPRFVRPPDLFFVPCSETALAEAVILYQCGAVANEISDKLGVQPMDLPAIYRKKGWAFLCDHAGDDFHLVVASRANRILSAVFDRLEQRLVEGDEVRDLMGNVVGRKPVPARQLSQIAHQMAQVKSEAGIHAGNQQPSVHIDAQDLVDALTAIARQNRTPKVIEGERCASL